MGDPTTPFSTILRLAYIKTCFEKNMLPAWHEEDVEIYPDLNLQIALRLYSDARHFKKRCL